MVFLILNAQNDGIVMYNDSEVNMESDRIDLVQLNAVNLRLLNKEKMHELIKHQLSEEMKTLSVKRGAVESLEGCEMKKLKKEVFVSSFVNFDKGKNVVDELSGKKFRRSKEVLECEYVKWKEGHLSNSVLRIGKSVVEEEFFCFNGDEVVNGDMLKGSGWPSPVTEGS